MYPSFKSYTGRDPEPGRDYDPNASLCQDDYEFFTGTGRYSNDVDAPVENMDGVFPIGVICPRCHRDLGIVNPYLGDYLDRSGSPIEPLIESLQGSLCDECLEEVE